MGNEVITSINLFEYTVSSNTNFYKFDQKEFYTIIRTSKYNSILFEK